jgi:hypothetical protein
MKNLKYVKTFEGFKVNEEVPYDYSAGREFASASWTPEEKSDLERLGADTIGKNDATFVKNGGALNVKVTKYMPRPRSYVYKAESDKSDQHGPNAVEGFGMVNWRSFLHRLDSFMRNGGLEKNPMSRER